MQINRSFLLKYLFIAFLFLCCVLCVPYRPFSARRSPGECIVFCAGDFYEPVFPSSLCTFPLPVHSFLIFPFCRIFAAVLSCSVSSRPFSARHSSGESIVFCAGDFHEPVLLSSLCTFPLHVHSFLIFPFCCIFAAVLSCSVSCCRSVLAAVPASL